MGLAFNVKGVSPGTARGGYSFGGGNTSFGAPSVGGPMGGVQQVGSSSNGPLALNFNSAVGHTNGKFYNFAGQEVPDPGNSGGAGSGGDGNVSLNAQKSPELDALSGRYTSYLDNIEKGSGQIVDQAGARLRDAREGGRAALQQSQGFRGVNSSNSLGNYDAQTTRGEQGAIVDAANGRQQMMGDALRGGVGVYSAPYTLAMGEKGLQLQAANSASQNADSQFNHFLALLNAQRSSPIYSGFAGMTGSGMNDPNGFMSAGSYGGNQYSPYGNNPDPMSFASSPLDAQGNPGKY